MSVPYNLVEEGSPILLETMLTVLEFNSDLGDISERMIDTMIVHEGLGLAAPQCNLGLRMFVMRHQDDIIACVNPTISQSDEPILCSEGCLSFPGLTLKIRRANKIVGQYFTINGEIVTETFEGVEAQCFQHELDHLDGITFDKRVSNLVLNMAKRKRQKQRGN